MGLLAQHQQQLHQQSTGPVTHLHSEERIPVHPQPGNLSSSYPPHRSPYLSSHNSLPPQSSPSVQTFSSLQYQHTSPPIVNLAATATSLSQGQTTGSPAYSSQNKINSVYGKLGSQNQSAQQNIIVLTEDQGGGDGGETPTSNHGGSDRSSW